MSSTCKEIVLCLCLFDSNATGSDRADVFQTQWQNAIGDAKDKHDLRCVKYLTPGWDITATSHAALTDIRIRFGENRIWKWTISLSSTLSNPGEYARSLEVSNYKQGGWGGSVWQPLGTLWKRVALAIYFTSSCFSLAEDHLKVCSWSCWSRFNHCCATL